jgi:M6 family metalloprotease-like protein
MKKIWRYLVFAIVFTSFINPAYAVPSAEIEQQFQQADGVAVEVVQKGDEWNNWIETSSGYTIEKAADGNWYYVTGFDGSNASGSSNAVFAGKVRADLVPPSGLEKGIKPSNTRPSQAPGVGTGAPLNPAPNGAFTGKILFILASFNDRSGSTSETSWGTFVSNNIADYFNKVSYGKVTLEPATESFGTANNGVVGWVNLGYNHPNTNSSTGTANQTLTKNAIMAANPYIDYSAYDMNNDGFVDSDELAIVVIVAGYERSYSSTYTPSVWGHKWSITSFPTVDGVKVGAYHSGAGGYAQFGELHKNSSTNQHQATMGIMVHELGHLIFAYPDLYDTDSSSSGIGGFGVMGGGSWGRKATDTYAGATPVFPSAWSQLRRGWVNAAIGSGTETITAAGSGSATSANAVYKATTGTSSQYFLVQNRQNMGYDRGLERFLGTGFSGGLNIFHIDDTKTSNASDANRWVDVEEADGTQMGRSSGSNGDLWRAGNAIKFDNTSTPNSKLYGGASSGVDINSISSTGTTMTATFGSGSTVPGGATLISPSGNITDSTPTYIWNAVSNSTWYYLWANDSTGNVIKKWYTAAQVGCTSGSGTCSITSTKSLANGAGKWWIRTWNSTGYGPWGAGKSFNVTATGGTKPGAATLVSPTGSITDSTPTYTWNAVSNSTWYYLWGNDSTGNVIKKWYTAAQAGCTSGAGTCSVTPTTSLANGAGKWWIRTWNSTAYGSWSLPKSFKLTAGNTTPGAVTLISPSGSITDSTPTYTWNAVSNSTWYYLWANDSTGNVIKKWYTAVQAGCTSGTGTCSITPTTTLANGAGKWWIRTWNTIGYGLWSAGKNFNVTSLTSKACNINATFASNSLGWAQNSDTWTVGTGYYYTPGTASSAYATSTYTPSASCSNLDVTAKQWRNTANAGNMANANALLIRASGSVSADGLNANYYAFQWTRDGRYSVWKRVAGVSAAVKGWTATTAVNASGWNTIRAVAVGSSLKYYLNGTLVWSGSDTSLSTGSVGVREYKADTTTPLGFWVDFVTSAPAASPDSALSSASTESGTSSSPAEEIINPVQALMNQESIVGEGTEGQAPQ